MSELYHHGVSGMKWGKRNGPPYPLNAAGKKSLAKQRKESSKASSGQAELDASVKGKKKNNVTIVKDSKGRVKSITGKIDINSKTESGVYRGTSKKPQEAVSYKDKTAEEIAIAKQQAIREGNVNEVQKNRNYYTDDEIRAAITRHGLNAELKDITAKHVKTGAERVDAIISAVKKGTALAETGIDAYNVVAKITNSLGGDMPVLDGKKPDSQYNVFDKKTKTQLEEIISNPHKYTAKEIDGANDAYETLLKAQKNVRADKNKNLTVEAILGNKDKYTEDEIKNAMSRSDTLDKLWKNTVAKQEEAESYANMKAEVFKAVEDMNKPLSEIGKEYFEDKKPWWDDDKLKI